MRWLGSITDPADVFERTVGDSEGEGRVVCCSPWGHRVGHDRVTEQQYTVVSKIEGSDYGTVWETLTMVLE